MLSMLSMMPETVGGDIWNCGLPIVLLQDLRNQIARKKITHHLYLRTDIHSIVFLFFDDKYFKEISVLDLKIIWHDITVG